MARREKKTRMNPDSVLLILTILVLSTLVHEASVQESLPTLTNSVRHSKKAQTLLGQEHTEQEKSSVGEVLGSLLKAESPHRKDVFHETVQATALPPPPPSPPPPPRLSPPPPPAAAAPSSPEEQPQQVAATAATAATMAAASRRVCAKGDAICIPSNYSKFDLPNETQTVVNVGIDIKDIPKIDDREYSITLNAFFVVRWTDRRMIIDQEKMDQVCTVPPHMYTQALTLAHKHTHPLLSRQNWSNRLTLIALCLRSDVQARRGRGQLDPG